MYQSAIYLNGVGIRVTHNLHPQRAAHGDHFGGNDHRIEFNEIHDVCRESNDAGAIYGGRDWTMRGTKVRHNYFHDISGFQGRGCVGVYLDDQLSGIEIRGNLFCKVTRAAMIGGGRDCSIVNNVFVDCVPATQGRLPRPRLGGVRPRHDGKVVGRRALSELAVGRPLSGRLVHILDQNPMAPVGNLIARNICVRGTWGDFDNEAEPIVQSRTICSTGTRVCQTPLIRTSN